MPVAVVWIAAALVVGAISFATLIAINRWLKLKHTVAFIGRPKSGKTTMAHVLEYGDVPVSDFPPTVAQNASEELLVGDLTLVVIDTAGDRIAQWESALEQSGGVVYFFDASLVAEGDPEALSALAADADHIQNFLKPHLAIDRKFTLVGTHTDRFKDRRDAKHVRGNREVQRLRDACEVGDSQLVLGSLKDKKSALHLAAKVAKQQSKESV